MLKELVLLVRKEAFFSSRADDSDIWISLGKVFFEGALHREDLMSGVMPLINRCGSETEHGIRVEVDFYK